MEMIILNDNLLIWSIHLKAISEASKSILKNAVK